MARDFRLTILLSLAILFLSFDYPAIRLQQILLSTLKIDIGPLLNFLQKNISDIIVILIITFFVDYRLSKESIIMKVDDVDAVKRLLSDIKFYSDPNEAIKYHLQTLYGSNINGISNILGNTKTIYFDAKVSIRMVECQNTDEFFYTQEIEFKCKSQNIYFAIVSTPDQQDKAFNVDYIDEVFSLSKNNTSQSDALKYAEKIDVKVVKSDDKGFVRENAVQVQPATDRTVKDFYKKSMLTAADGVFVFVANISKYKADLNSRIIIKYPDATFSKDIPFTYWIVDRPVFLKEINIDAMQFSSDRQATISAMPFLASYTGTTALKNIPAHVEPLRMIVDSWCTYGQGVLITWRNHGS